MASISDVMYGVLYKNGEVVAVHITKSEKGEQGYSATHS